MKKLFPGSRCFLKCDILQVSARLLVVFLLVMQVCLNVSAQVKPAAATVLPGKPYLLPNGWKIAPAGREIRLGGMPLNIVHVPNSKYAVVVSDGYAAHFIALMNLETEQILDRQFVQRGWLGVTVSSDGKTVYASASGLDKILVFGIEDVHLKPLSELAVPKGTFPAGLKVSPNGKYLYVAGNHNNTLLQVELSGNKINTWQVGVTPYTCTLSADAKTVFVSNWGENTVSLVDVAAPGKSEKLVVNAFPNDMIVSRDGNYLFVACGSRNQVSVVDIKLKKVIENIEVALYPNSLPGSTPNALALSEDGHTLYVGNADNNCIAVMDVTKPSKSQPLGFIPTGWYPSALCTWGNKIIVANGKGSTSGPSGDKNNNIPGVTSTQLLEGTLSFIDKPEKLQLDKYTKQVYANTPYRNKEKLTPRLPFALGDKGPIKYVFYIIKENRTYDQIFGDMKIGNGDPYYCFFPEQVTPNHHKLAKQFVLLDNFYHDAEVSADGHFWSNAAYATDYVEKFWPSSYSGQASPRLNYHDDSAAYPKSGFLWDLCAAKGITYRSYGEFARVWIPKGDEKAPSFETLKSQKFSWSAEDYKKGMKIRPGTPSLEGHYHPEYAGSDYIQGMSDSKRFEVWVKEFRQFVKAGEMPRFTVLSLPGDHLLGTRPGVQTPRAMMAENDLILGKLVEEISRSPFWKQTAIFVIEDDPQSGADHVDCHRVPAFVISPYTQRGMVDNTMYSSSGMLRTMEELLGLPPLTQYDASATPMWNSFTSKPNLAPYIALKNQVPLDELNTTNAIGALESIALPLDRADAAPDGEYNLILWKAIKGERIPYPPLKRAAFVFSTEEEDEDED